MQHPEYDPEALCPPLTQEQELRVISRPEHYTFDAGELYINRANHYAVATDPLFNDRRFRKWAYTEDTLWIHVAKAIYFITSKRRHAAQIQRYRHEIEKFEEANSYVEEMNQRIAVHEHFIEEHIRFLSEIPGFPKELTTI